MEDWLKYVVLVAAAPWWYPVLREVVREIWHVAGADEPHAPSPTPRSVPRPFSPVPPPTRGVPRPGGPVRVLARPRTQLRAVTHGERGFPRRYDDSA